MINLMFGDCLERMKEIPDGSVDLIATDLPYGTTACKWDSVIPLEPLWVNIKKVLKPSGVFLSTSCQPFTSSLVMSNPDWFKYDWVWRKPRGTGHLNARKQPLRNKEDIVVFYRNQSTYNPQFTKGEPYKAKAGKDHQSLSSMTECYGVYTNYRNNNDGTRYPVQVIEFGVVERGCLHPTEKPVDLYEYLVNTYSNPGDTVLDICMGSGTTGEACINTGRNFIGIENHRPYYEIACGRLGVSSAEESWEVDWQDES